MINYLFVEHEMEVKKNNYADKAKIIFNDIENSLLKHEVIIASIQSFLVLHFLLV